MGKNRKKLESSKIVYFILVGIVLLELIGAIFSIAFATDATTRDVALSNLFLAIMAIVLFSIPWIIESRFKIDIPNLLEITVLIFIFCALVLGNIHKFLVTVDGYDKVLHLVSGVTIEVIGFEIIHRWNKSRAPELRIGAGLQCILAFMFSVTLLVFWEFYEFTNMQRYQWINTSTVFPQPYGLFDTMMDLIIGTLGAVIVSLIGWRVLLKQQKKTVK